MAAYVVIPGIDGSDEHHWQTLWERQWGTVAVRIAPNSWSTPDLGDWVDALQRAYDDAADRGQPVVLVAHSLGCWAASAWLNGNPAAPIGGAFLAAPADPNGPAFPRRQAPTFTALTAQPLPCPALVVGSANDPYCTLEAAAGFATRWRARWHLAGADGHLNSASGLGSWQRGRELLDSMPFRG